MINPLTPRERNKSDVASPFHCLPSEGLWVNEWLTLNEFLLDSCQTEAWRIELPLKIGNKSEPEQASWEFDLRLGDITSSGPSVLSEVGVHSTKWSYWRIERKKGFCQQGVSSKETGGEETREWLSAEHSQSKCWHAPEILWAWFQITTIKWVSQYSKL